jgi:ribosomal protein L40E
MLCSKCNYDNPADASFCEECGSKLELACPACKALVNPGARFCKRCGTAIGAAKPDPHAAGSFSESQIKVTGDTGFASEAIDGERKTVTALFADIKGSTELMRDLDPEEARAIVDPVLQLMMAAVHRYGGNVASTQRSATRCRTCLGCWGFRTRPTRSPRWTRKSGADARSKRSGGSSCVKA